MLPLTEAVRGLDGVRFMRDPTRGGLATVMHELMHATGLQLRLDSNRVPVRDPVVSVCEMLGYDEDDEDVLLDWYHLVHPDDMARVQARMRDHLEGIPLDLAAHLLPGRTRLSFGLGPHIHIHARAQRQHADAGGVVQERLAVRGAPARPSRLAPRRRRSTRRRLGSCRRSTPSSRRAGSCRDT